MGDEGGADVVAAVEEPAPGIAEADDGPQRREGGRRRRQRTGEEGGGGRVRGRRRES